MVPLLAIASAWWFLTAWPLMPIAFFFRPCNGCRLCTSCCCRQAGSYQFDLSGTTNGNCQFCANLDGTYIFDQDELSSGSGGCDWNETLSINLGACNGFLGVQNCTAISTKLRIYDFITQGLWAGVYAACDISGAVLFLKSKDYGAVGCIDETTHGDGGCYFSALPLGTDLSSNDYFCVFSTATALITAL